MVRHDIPNLFPQEEEDALVRWTRGMPKPEPPKQQPKLDTSPASSDWSAWEAWLRARLDAERQCLANAIGESLAELLDEERGEYQRALADEVRGLRLELAALEGTLSELRRMLTAERAAVLDLPALPSARRAN
jgi:hypothetical protein